VRYWWDLETWHIKAGAVSPLPIAGGFQAEGEGDVQIYGVHQPMFWHWIDRMLKDGINVGAHTSFDWACILAARPDEYVTRIFQMYEEERVRCVQTSQKVLDLSFSGWLDDAYSLNALGSKYGWRSRDADKDKKNTDVWRMRYPELSRVDARDWPEEARAYLVEDVEETRFVDEKQQQLAAKGIANGLSLVGEEFLPPAQFGLELITANPFWTDLPRAHAAQTALDAALSPEVHAPLYDAGILDPPKPIRPYKKGTIDSKTGKPKMKKAVAEKENKKATRTLVRELCMEHGMRPVLTDKGKDAWGRRGGVAPEKYVSTGADMRGQLRGLSPVLDLFQKRQEVIKLQTTYFPKLRAGNVYGSFDVVKKTGRTSSAAHGLIVESMNMQNPPQLEGELSVRECMLPPIGRDLTSVDYGSLELCTLAQTCLNLTGQSQLAHVINTYGDAHEYLGAQICYIWEQGFRRVCDKAGWKTSNERFLAFRELKKTDKRTWKHYRTFAKPTGLGYPGGLGPDTFVLYARTVFGINVTKQDAESLRNIWHACFPEMSHYFRCVKAGVDSLNRGKLRYVTPQGMVRAGCDYCAASNGFGMQSPAAEGAKRALFSLARQQFDPSMNSLLLGCRTHNFVHDEFLVSISQDPKLGHQQAHQVAHTMIESMRSLCPDITIRAEPARMKRWYKGAEAVYDDSGYLKCWEPS
jgi:hypothetical protein